MIFNYDIPDTIPADANDVNADVIVKNDDVNENDNHDNDNVVNNNSDNNNLYSYNNDNNAGIMVTIMILIIMITVQG